MDRAWRLATLCIVTALWLAPAAAATAIQDTAQTPCELCPRRRPVMAVAQTLLTNVVVNRFDVWVLGLEWARVSPSTWSRNLRGGWRWDDDQFLINMLGHPYQGGSYFKAGRSNGLTFWESAPLTVLGSVTWEYFGERTAPSINDFFNTTFGGIATGEMSYRIAATIRDNTHRGGSRLIREILALPFDPTGGFNRLINGDWKRVGKNPEEHDPTAVIVRIGGGAGRVRPSFDDGRSTTAGILYADFDYGDPFIEPSRKPFDAFSVRAEQSLNGKSTKLRGTGRVVGGEIGRGTGSHRHQWEINQRFDYFNNFAYQLGGQSLQVGVISRLRLRGNVWLRARVASDAIVLAGVDAANSDPTVRDYDFGPGVGATLTSTIEHRGVPYLTVHFQPAWVRSISGSRASHSTTFSGVEAFLPLGRGMGLALHTSHYRHTTRNPGEPKDRRSYPELRLFGWFKLVSRPAASDRHSSE